MALRGRALQMPVSASSSPVGVDAGNSSRARCCWTAFQTAALRAAFDASSCSYRDYVRGGGLEHGRAPWLAGHAACLPSRCLSHSLPGPLLCPCSNGSCALATLRLSLVPPPASEHPHPPFWRVSWAGFELGSSPLGGPARSTNPFSVTRCFTPPSSRSYAPTSGWARTPGSSLASAVPGVSSRRSRPLPPLYGKNLVVSAGQFD